MNSLNFLLRLFNSIIIRIQFDIRIDIRLSSLILFRISIIYILKKLLLIDRRILSNS